MMRLKSFIAAAVLAVIAAGPSVAADMAVKPYYKASPLPAFTWSGFFIGGHGAYGSGSTKWTENELGAGNGPPGFQDASLSEKDWLGGGQAGFNYQLQGAPVVWGIWADDSAGKLHSGTVAGCFPEIAGTTQSCSTTIKNIGTLVGRVGFAANQVLFYALGGWAWAAGVDSAVSCGGINGGANCAGGPGMANTNYQSIFGYTVGAGIEYAFNMNWSVFAQYNYMDFGRWGENLSNTGVIFTENFRQNINVVKFGINFRFGQPTVMLPP